MKLNETIVCALRVGNHSSCCSQDSSSLARTLGYLYSVTSATLLPMGGFMDAQKISISGTESQCPPGYLEEYSLAGKTPPCQRERQRQREYDYLETQKTKKNHDNKENVLLCFSSCSVCRRLRKSHSQLCEGERSSPTPFRRPKQRKWKEEALLTAKPLVPAVLKDWVHSESHHYPLAMSFIYLKSIELVVPQSTTQTILANNSRAVFL